MANDINLRKLIQSPDSRERFPRMPAMFVGHGNPMNAILDNSFTRTWRAMGSQLPRPSAILSVSAHWLTTNGTKVTAMEQPETIHDFGGFPAELYRQQYPAPGSGEFARKTQRVVHSTEVALDYDWGLDHGTWSVLKPMFPLADVPVYQLSIDYGKPPQFHYELGTQVRTLREQGVLIIGSGNIVHNLAAAKMGSKPFDWALEFDARVGSWLEEKNDAAILDFHNLGSLASAAHPTPDHFLPLLYVIGARDPHDSVEFFNMDIDMGSVSMRSMVYR